MKLNPEEVIESKKILDAWITRGRGARKDQFVEDCEKIKRTLEALSPGIR